MATSTQTTVRLDRQTAAKIDTCRDLWQKLLRKRFPSVPTIFMANDVVLAEALGEFENFLRAALKE
jgi:hypothetical protein